MERFQFKPGSDSAVSSGCLCPVIDNHYGKGAYGIGEVYWIGEKCPIHGLKGAYFDKDRAKKKD